jgi:hypothetical protein|tara:strand:- start:459 stop:656 length:198 start_codon:yes stop_codon:yes gene_type:complete
MSELWVCRTCGGENVQQKSWTYINTDGLVDYIDGEYYCDDCQSDAIRVVLQSELFNEVKEKKNNE